MITPEQIKGARAMLGWSAQELANNAGIGIATIQRMEGRGTGSSSAENVDSVEKALESAGIIFLPDDINVDGGPGVRLREK